MASTHDITGATQRAVVAWLGTYAATWAALSPTWVPRILTGYKRQSAGASLSQMEEAGEPDTIIVECSTATPSHERSPVHIASVNVRIRHDPDRVSEVNHSLRVNEVAKVFLDSDAATELSEQDDFTCFDIVRGDQQHTPVGRSYETTLSFALKVCGEDIA